MATENHKGALDEVATKKSPDLADPIEVSSMVPSIRNAKNADNDDSLHGIDSNKQSDQLLQKLAQQLEYYFSAQNLATDAYLCRLRDLNDGYVPANILANFAKVCTIDKGASDETLRVEHLVQAARHYSSKLQVVSIDPHTSKAMIEHDASQHALPAIGPVSSDPLEMQTQHLLRPPDCTTLVSSTVCNTIILRDMVPEVACEHVLEAFNFEGCPAVKSIHWDVYNCWFVTLDTDCRETMIFVLMQLQRRTILDAPVHARIKSSAHLVETKPVWYADTNTASVVGNDATGSKKKKKKKTRSKKKKRQSDNSSTPPSSSPEHSPSPTRTLTNAAPPSMGEDNFPTLQDKKVEWEAEVGPDVEEDGGAKSLRSSSDAASTATTTSSSTESATGGNNKKMVAGYAAVLRRGVVPQAVQEYSSSSSSLTMSSSSPSLSTTMTRVTDEQLRCRTRSFADVAKAV